MKKILSILLAMLLVLSVVPAAMANSDVTVTLDGEKIEFDVQPQIINDRTMVPLRAIFEALGATVEWDETTRTVTSTKEEKTIKLTIDSPTMYVNEEAVELDSPATIVSDRTLVPVRKIFETLGATVDYDDATRTVISRKGELFIVLQIDNDVMFINGEAKKLDVPAREVGGRTLVPLRAISEAMNVDVAWDDATSTAKLFSK